MQIIIQIITSIFLIIMCKIWFDPEMPKASKVLATLLGIFLGIIAAMVLFAQNQFTHYLYVLMTAIQLVHPLVILLVYALHVWLGVFTGMKCAKHACLHIPEEDHKLRLTRSVKVAAITSTLSVTVTYLLQAVYAMIVTLLIYLSIHQR